MSLKHSETRILFIDFLQRDEEQNLYRIFNRHRDLRKNSIVISLSLVSESSSVSEGTCGWSTRHPDNWSPDTVEEWINFTAMKHRFPDNTRKASVEMFRDCAGNQLTQTSLPDFRRRYGVIGEIIHTALQQILDLAPGYQGKQPTFYLLFVSQHYDV